MPGERDLFLFTKNMASENESERGKERGNGIEEDQGFVSKSCFHIKAFIAHKSF